jgi:hypothetical protein
VPYGTSARRIALISPDRINRIMNHVEGGDQIELRVRQCGTIADLENDAVSDSGAVRCCAHARLTAPIQRWQVSVLFTPRRARRYPIRLQLLPPFGLLAARQLQQSLLPANNNELSLAEKSASRRRLTMRWACT